MIFFYSNELLQKIPSILDGSYEILDSTRIKFINTPLGYLEYLGFKRIEE